MLFDASVAFYNVSVLRWYIHMKEFPESNFFVIPKTPRLHKCATHMTDPFKTHATILSQIII